MNQLNKLLLDLNDQTEAIHKKPTTYLVTIDDVYPEADTLLSYDGSPIAIKGELSAIVGKAKSRKSFFNTLMIKQLVAPDPNWETNLKGGVLYIDTEQRPARVQTMLRRLEQMSVDTSKHLFGAIRSLDTDSKVKEVETLLQNNSDTEYVIIDNIRDFLPSGDINNQEEATKVTNAFVKLAEKHQVHISVVLHTNPVAPSPGEQPKPSGALGTRLLQICSSVIYIEKKSDTTSLVHPMEMRDGEFESFAMHIVIENDLAIPRVALEDPRIAEFIKAEVNFKLAIEHYNDEKKMGLLLKSILDEETTLNTEALAARISREFKEMYDGSTPKSASGIKKDVSMLFHKRWALITKASSKSPWKMNTDIDLPF